VADAAGLAIFTIDGTTLALAAGASRPVAVLLGVITGTGGGVARDVLARQRPLILVGQIYALSAAAGAGVLVVLTDTHTPPKPPAGSPSPWSCACWPSVTPGPSH
jgi:uncharacterized membrane protein YeiH